MKNYQKTHSYEVVNLKNISPFLLKTDLSSKENPNISIRALLTLQRKNCNFSLILEHIMNFLIGCLPPCFASSLSRCKRKTNLLLDSLALKSCSLHVMSKKEFSMKPIDYLQQRLDALEVSDHTSVRILCRLILASCPFERDLKILRRILLHITPLCQLNPFYEQFVGLRFRALHCLENNRN